MGVIHLLHSTVFVVAFVYSAPDERKDSKPDRDGAAECKCECPRKGLVEAGVVQLKTLGSLVHDEEHCRGKLGKTVR